MAHRSPRLDGTRSARSAKSVPVASFAVVVTPVVRQHEIPTITTVFAPVRHHIPRIPGPVFAGCGDEVAPSSTVDTGDRLLGVCHAAHLGSPILGRVRVVAGELRGRRIVAPPGNDTRPTSDKVRQAVFNALESAGLVDGAAVVDLFAGSGAMGIEALSRGASSCVFVERDRAALASLRSNIEALHLADRSRVVVGDAATQSVHLRGADLVLADPPYRFDGWEALLRSIDAPDVIVESDREILPCEGWETVRVRRYGRTVITWLQRVA